MCKLLAWTLLGTGLEDKNSLRTLPVSFLSCYGLHHVLFTIENGTSSVLVVQIERQIDPVSFPSGDLGDFFLRFTKTCF